MRNISLTGNPATVEELKATLQKSYYKKAKVIEVCGNTYLMSYNTVVCGIVNNEFFKYWDDYSSTTMKHINDFRMRFGYSSINKKEWDSLKTMGSDLFCYLIEKQLHEDRLENLYY